MRPLRMEHAEAQLIRAWRTGDAVAARHWERQVDQLDPAARGQHTASLPGAALWYAEHGLHVFPLSPGSKKPLPRTHGLTDASPDPDKVRAWWGRVPDANIGVATGHLVDVLDVDGLPGNIALARDTVQGLLDDCHAFQLGQVLTPRPGGRHFYTSAAGHHNGASLAPGVDYRGAGGYVVAPPSRIVAGGKDTPGTYRWLVPLNLEGVT